MVLITTCNRMFYQSKTISKRW